MLEGEKLNQWLMKELDLLQDDICADKLMSMEYEKD